jgi:hypothetical protein
MAFDLQYLRRRGLPVALAAVRRVSEAAQQASRARCGAVTR